MTASRSGPSSSGSATVARWRPARRYRNELGLLAAIVVVVAATSAISDAYRTKPVANATEILRQTALLGTFALGAAIVIIAGGIDLSSGSVIAFSGTVCASIMLALAPLDATGNPDTSQLTALTYAAAFGGTLLVGFLIGTLHAWLITVVGLPPFVATLASLVGLRSLGRVYIQEVTAVLTPTGRTTQIYVFDQTFARLGSTWWIPLLVFLTLAAAAWLLMARTVVGRHLYAMGGNEAAARLSGIRTDRLKWLAYVLSAVMASIAGILYTAEVGTANPTVVGRGYELNAIAAAVVGGCSLAGGAGTIPGTVLGVLFLRVVIDSVAKIVKSNSDDYEGIIVGLLVVLAVAFNALRRTGQTRQQFFPGALGVVTIAILAGLAGLLGALAFGRHQGLAASLVTLAVLALAKLIQHRASRRG